MCLQVIHHKIEIECFDLHYDQIQSGSEILIQVPEILHSVDVIIYITLILYLLLRMQTTDSDQTDESLLIINHCIK